MAGAENGGNKTPLVFNLPAISPFVFVVPNILFPALNSTTFVADVRIVAYTSPFYRAF